MPREWYPMRFFVRENGRNYPTILFWLFLIPILVILMAGCFSWLRPDEPNATVVSTATFPPTDTSAPMITDTPQSPAVEATELGYVYDDPSNWEFIEKTDTMGQKYLDLQDWQKEQVWHAFDEFWELLYRNESGLPEWEEVEPFVDGSFTEFARGTYNFASENDKYMYLIEGVDDVPHRALLLHSDEEGKIKIKVMLIMDRSYRVEYRNPETGEVVEDGKWLPFENWSFILSYRIDRWVIEEQESELFEQ